MNENEICSAIVESLPYPVVFVDLDNVIRYVNRAARYHYYEERGHAKLVGKSLFDCHFNPASKEQIEAIVERFRQDAKEFLLKVDDRNYRVYICPVKTRAGELIGYFERFEMNLCLQRQPM